MDTQLQQISQWLATQPDIRLAVGFGSVAEGTAKPDSDIDIAVRAEQPLDAERKMALIEGIASLAGRTVDLVDLARIGEPLRGEVLRGQRLFGSDEDWAEQMLRHIYDNEDFVPYVRRLLAERRERWLR
ncbi:type VII toxin-antitoxin system MntA family adenylyltransferase antitoxin [Wenzhouxiangella limi]|uniref:Nucleotidyltransferase domain-containing protein n=1 Tax=Wenzhouxiangella limi TaxID=2707351 RepID=A0A845V0V2_9GAMM|nr:nucleotidyltransferase domain-containing protein [Wenzhouxiangella limi]NDY94906.1 nucleotidyltransferase domain-containing protein [Wenzhouxiangella limi]